ncbi:hypothetical protein EIP91_009001 [Steccherinum ochraceum]|uniref:Uncharacterized protein n=1 Tax=Steccherinum ochraceum TaxID=92696 RepID=A0A4R0R4J1_9APHY|nr:hypothetical protein EIP91_009001 [Steccherinum ochraceum]
MSSRGRYSITLTPNTVYIYTTPLMGSDSFHWNFVYVSSDKNYSRHHWAQDTRATSNDVAAHGFERYLNTMLGKGAQSHSGESPVLIYFPVLSPAPDLKTFVEVCNRTFRGQDRGSTNANRAAGITCRTWVTAVLMNWMTREQAVTIEKKVTAASQAASNKFASSYLTGQVFQTDVRGTI